MPSFKPNKYLEKTYRRNNWCRLTTNRSICSRWLSDAEHSTASWFPNKIDEFLTRTHSIVIQRHVAVSWASVCLNSIKRTKYAGWVSIKPTAAVQSAIVHPFHLNRFLNSPRNSPHSPLSFNAGARRTGRRIPIPLPNTGALARKRNSFYLRAVLVICLVLFAFLQLHIINYREYMRHLCASLLPHGHRVNRVKFPFFLFIGFSHFAIRLVFPVVWRCRWLSREFHQWNCKRFNGGHTVDGAAGLSQIFNSQKS